MRQPLDTRPRISFGHSIALLSSTLITTTTTTTTTAAAAATTTTERVTADYYTGVAFNRQAATQGAESR